MKYDSPIDLLLILGGIILIWALSSIAIYKFDKWARRGNANIVEVTYDGPGRVKTKKLGAKGVVYGAVLGGWLGAMVAPHIPNGHKETACFTVKYRDGHEAHLEAVVGSNLYDALISRMN